MKIKMRQSLAFVSGEALRAGEKLDRPALEAKRWIDRDIAAPAGKDALAEYEALCEQEQAERAEAE